MTQLEIETASLGAYADATEADLHRVVSLLNEDIRRSGACSLS